MEKRKGKRQQFKKWSIRSILLLIIGLALVWLNHSYIMHSTAPFIYNDVNELPKNRVGLVLGTSKTLPNGRTNIYYRYRLEAAVKLYKANKIDYILVSGDNSRKEYNEAEDMQSDLMAAGIPKSRIYLDYAGFRTLDSVVRAKEIFGQTKFTCISQAFHNERAVFIAQNKALDVVAFNAKDVSMRYGFKVQLREYLARVKMLLDLFVINKQPKFLGDKIEIK